MSFAEFAACAREWSSRRISLRVELRPPAAPGTAPPPPPQQQPPPSRVPRLQAELEALVDWGWLAAEVQVPLTYGRALAASVIASSPPSVRPLRYMAQDTLLCQVAGRTRALLISPRYTYDGLYPYPTAHPYDGYTMVDPAAPDVGEWPLFTRVRGAAAVLAPGDVLLVPRGWWLQLQHLRSTAHGGEHTMLELRLAPGRRVRSADAAFPAVGRRIEELATEEEGPAAARAWLERLACGRPAPPRGELGTPKGYRRALLTSAIWEEVAGLTPRITRDRGAAFVASVIERRMLPTPWLNANFRQPLYLTGAPRRRRLRRRLRRS
jgi:hypothetical protein